MAQILWIRRTTFGSEDGPRPVYVPMSAASINVLWVPLSTWVSVCDGTFSVKPSFLVSAGTMRCATCAKVSMDMVFDHVVNYHVFPSQNKG